MSISRVQLRTLRAADLSARSAFSRPIDPARSGAIPAWSMMTIGFCYGCRRAGDLRTGSDRRGTRRLDWALPWVDTTGVRIHGLCPTTFGGRTSADGSWGGHWHSPHWASRNCRHPPTGRPAGSTGAECYWASLVSGIEDPGRKARTEPLNAGRATRASGHRLSGACARFLRDYRDRCSPLDAFNSKVKGVGQGTETSQRSCQT